jgi:hypothetical protein
LSGKTKNWLAATLFRVFLRIFKGEERSMLDKGIAAMPDFEMSAHLRIL